MAAKKKKELNQRQALDSWLNLNEFLRTATETSAESLLEMEKHGRRRIDYLRRIYGRYNLLRAQRERIELLTTKVV